MKKITSLALCLGLTAALCVHALAAGSAEIVRAFVYEGSLYTYVSMDGMEKPVTKAEAKVDGQTFAATSRLETVRQAGSPVTWLLLVDNSTSMPAFRQETEYFARALSQSGGENTKFILATFGDAFALAEEDVPPEELAEEIEKIPFDERVTRLHTAISQALDYFESLPRQRNELRCMAVLSDGVQYDPQGGVPYDELLERVGLSDVMLHSVGLGSDRASLDNLGQLASASGGLHQEIDAQTAEQAASRLTQSSGALYVTGFDLSGCSFEGGEEQVSVTFASDGELICRAESLVELPELAGTPTAPEDREDPSLPAGDTPVQLPNSAPAAADEQKPPIVLILGAAAVLAAAAAAVLLRKKSRPSPQTGIYVRLELVQGKLAGGPQELDLNHALMIGADPACDIAVRDSDAAPRHARLFSKEGAVYVEDLCAPAETRINGTPLRGAQRLRSGDEVALGSTVIRFRF